MHALARVLLSSLLFLAVACEPPSSPPDESAPPPVEEGPGVPIVDLRADVNRDGVVDLSDPTEDEGEDTWTAGRGAIFLANIDDDLGACPYSPHRETLSDVELAGCHDAADAVVNGEDDLDDLARLRTAPWARAPADAEGTLTVSGAAAGQVRLFRARAGGFQVFEPSTDRLTAEELRRGVTLAIEGKDIVRDLGTWDGYADVVLAVTWRGGPAEPLRDTVRLRLSPVMTFHHLSPAQSVLVADLTSSPTVVEDSRRFQGALDVARADAGVVESLFRYTTVDEKWVQDYMEPGYMAMPGRGGGQQVIRVNYRAPYVINPEPTSFPGSPLGTGGRLAFLLRGPGIAAVQQYDVAAYRDGRTKQTYNSTGNLETVPPYEKDGVRYPLGRLLMGSTPTARPDPSFTRMLEAQRMQPPLYLDTSWLDVGHVDEILSFVPANTPRGWLTLVADPLLARRMLEDAQARGHGEARLFTGKTWGRNARQTPAEVTVSQVLANTAVLDASATAALKLDAQLATLRAELGLTDADLVRVPFLFQPTSRGVTAYQPGTVNLLVLSRTAVVAPDPHGPVIDGKDLFKAHLEAALAPHGITVHWVDDWNLYHRGLGNVHCATNAVRQVPDVKWWETGR
jgi:protein-arginine deiminase